MISDAILSIFKLRVSGDEGDPVDPVDPKDPKDKGDPVDPVDPKDPDTTQKLDVSKLDPAAQKMIKDLRAENAKHRTSNNNLTTKMEKFESGLKNLFGEGDDEDPSVQLEALTGNYESAVTRNAILELALENGVSGKKNVEYFEFLMNKSLSSLGEGEEMSEETLAEIVSQATPTKGNANTSTKKDGTDNKNPKEDPEEVTQEQFNKMGMTQKSILYRTKPELYKKLLAGANL